MADEPRGSQSVMAVPCADEAPRSPAGQDAATAIVESSPSRPHGWLGDLFAISISLVVHAALIVALGLWLLPRTAVSVEGLLVASVGERFEPAESIVPPTPIDAQPQSADDLQAAVVANEGLPSIDDISQALESSAAMATVDLPSVGIETFSSESLLSELSGGSITGLLGSRSDLGRKVSVATRGGSDATEAAVERALAWLAKHQAKNGSWNFNHHLAAGPCGCDHPGDGFRMVAINGATGLALLPFLAAGYTHKEGRYRDEVRDGLEYLVGHMQHRRGGGSFWERGGTTYSHALASLALCEAFAMTNDRSLERAAQLATNYTVNTQAPRGGWRYLIEQGQPGDTSVTGWQLMALKSANMGYLTVPPPAIDKVNEFLNTVQTNGGAEYSYEPGGEVRPSMSAVGLLCRMYMGWKHDEPGLVRGVELLAQQGPSQNDIYYNYYATQVLFHFEGPQWDAWNRTMRDSLLKTQSRRGHEEGSWFFAGDKHNDAGGRLYCTALATLILEVYYRHLPLYGKEAADADF